MRPITKYSMCAFAAAAVATSALAASSNYYLRLDDVKGESAAKAGGGKQLEILSWAWGATNAGKYGAVGGMHRDDGVSKPLNRGSVRVKVKLPWLDCRVGAAFPDAVLQNAAGRYELKDVVITNCPTSASGGDRPMESLSLNYAKVQVRGWDPATKK